MNRLFSVIGIAGVIVGFFWIIYMIEEMASYKPTHKEVQAIVIRYENELMARGLNEATLRRSKDLGNGNRLNSKSVLATE